jgi:hypothetical protein
MKMSTSDGKSKGERRLLIAEVVEARNITACDQRRGTSDSYVQASLRSCF